MAAPLNTSPPSITGLVIEGERLTAVPGVWDVVPDSTSVAWLSARPGGTEPVAQGVNYYDLVAADVGATITIEEAATAAGETGYATSAAVGPVSAVASTAYASVEELQRLLRIETPTDQQLEGMVRCLLSAATEINWDLGYTSAPNPVPPLVQEVNLERAVEHWRQSYSPFGVLGLGAESEPVVTARNSWYRHHLKLSPLRVHVGIA